MYLYCQNTHCGVYLGSLGGNSCYICGWSAGKGPECDHDFEAKAEDGGPISMGQPTISVCIKCGEKEVR